MRSQHILINNSVETMSLYQVIRSHKETKMKKFFTQIADFLESMGRIRAAAALARMGHHTAAQQLIARD